MVPFNYSMPYPAGRSAVMAQNVVATSQPLAAEAGIDALRRGGNAVDAALAAAIALTVVEPTANGVGSDAFAIVWDGSMHGLNGSGRSPRRWTAQRFGGLAEMPRRGWDSVTVPGAPSAWVTLSERFGRLPFSALFERAIALATHGFPVSPLIAEHWKRIAPGYAGQPGFATAFLPGGGPPVAGDWFTNRPLAETLAAIAETRAEAFYRGVLATRIADAARQGGALLDEGDLAAHRSEWCGTLCVPVATGHVHEIPPNTQGIAALIGLALLERLDLQRFALDGVDFHHLQIEATKLGLADAEAFVSDPEGMPFDAVRLLDEDYLDRRAALIDPHRAGDYGAGAPMAGGTVCVSAADASGMMVSYIQSNFEGFGSGVVVPGTGISLHNRAWGFSTRPGHANAVGAAKRPFHTIIPGMFTADGQATMAFGLMGGPMQAQGHIQLVVRTQRYAQNPQAASDAPRWRFVKGRTVAFEPEFPREVVDALAQRGHDVVVEPSAARAGFGGAQLIARVGRAYVAGSDHRKDGLAIGY